ncbi:MAG: diguanylate cyclase [Proteobacteria bacterium]|nr:diguanylate cyclase [Pseudomonadota bacterium]
MNNTRRAHPWRFARSIGALALPLALCLVALTQASAAAAPGPDLKLTDKEQTYLREHPSATFCVDPDWVPFERINEQGGHEGIAADLLRLVSQRTGLRLELVPTKSWEESLEASRQGRCKVLSFLNTTPEREAWLTFTAPLLSDPNVFITREKHPYIADPAGLSGQTIALPTGTSIEERVRRDYPNLTIILTESENKAVNLVSTNKADMTLRSLIVAAYTIRKEGLFNLKIAGQIPQYANQLRVGVRKDEPLLRGILDKGVRSITPQEREQIVNRHVSINAQMGVDYELIKKIVGGFLLVLLVSLYWIVRLRRLNAEIRRLSRTDPLTGLYNRVKFNADFPLEVERARRYQRPLSLLLLDIDHFKRINDELGHPMGDKVLVAMAQSILRSTRAHDTACRWGGEEFLVICPETEPQQALAMAERIRKDVEESEFPSQRRHSVSIGVTTLAADDTMDTLLQRVDTALYQAKHAGRNQARQI